MKTMAKILVLGASGYIGTQCVARLLEDGFTVVAGARNLSKLLTSAWCKHERVRLFQVDVRSQDSLKRACAGCTAVYYFVHSMDAQNKDFAKTDRMAAENMKKTAYEMGVGRIIYLGGLGEAKTHLSRHLRSRMEVSEILHSGHVPVTTLRAAMIIGGGSISFEIMRYIVEHLPMMVSSKWLETESQPIAIDNVLNYLRGVLQIQSTAWQIYDIGGPEIISYRRLMDMYAEEIGLNKKIEVPVPSLLIKSSSHWIKRITPYPESIVRPLVEGLRNRLVCQDSRIKQLLPQDLLDCRQAIRLAIKNHAFQPV